MLAELIIKLVHEKKKKKELMDYLEMHLKKEINWQIFFLDESQIRCVSTTRIKFLLFDLLVIILGAMQL